MARGVNKVILIGNLGNDPEVRYTPSGSAVANVNLATSETWRDKQTGELNDRTEWHRLVFFNRLAEIVGEYLHKGSKIYVEGSLRTRKWQDRNGIERHTTEIITNEMHILDSRNSNTGAAGHQQGAGHASAGGAGHASAGGAGHTSAGGAGHTSAGGAGSSSYQQPVAADQQSQGQAMAMDDGDIEDDIPF